MANRTTTQNGDISLAATWGGTLPASTDTATVAHHCTLPAGVTLTYVSLTVSSVGIIVYDPGNNADPVTTINANLLSASPGYSSVTPDNNGGGIVVNTGTLVINGNVTPTSGGAVGINMAEGGVLTVNGNVYGGTFGTTNPLTPSNTAYSVGIANIDASTIVINGNIDGQGGVGLFQNLGAVEVQQIGQFRINGNVTASGAGIGAWNQTGSILVINGNITATSGHGVVNTGSSLLYSIGGTSVSGTGGTGIQTDSSSSWYCIDSIAVTGTNSIATGSRILVPDPSKVRAGDVYLSGLLTGTLVVPANPPTGGAAQLTLTFTDHAGNPVVSGVNAPVAVVLTALTDQSGNTPSWATLPASFAGGPSVWTYALSVDGTYTFGVQATATNGTATNSITVAHVGASTIPGQCNCYTTTLDGQGNIVSGAAIRFVALNSGGGVGPSVGLAPVYASSSGTGTNNLAIELIQGQTYEGERGILNGTAWVKTGPPVNFAVPSAASFSLPIIPGK